MPGDVDTPPLKGRRRRRIIFSFSLPWDCDELRPSLQAFTIPTESHLNNFPYTLDTMFDPVYGIGIGLDELCACGVCGVR